jgi:serine/threonine protein kinase
VLRRLYYTDIITSTSDNIFLKKIQGSNSFLVKLGDFGCAERMGERLPAGTPGFYPPEFPNSVEESDIWQLGATISCVCTLQEIPNPSLIPGSGTLND